MQYLNHLRAVLDLRRQAREIVGASGTIDLPDAIVPSPATVISVDVWDARRKICKPGRVNIAITIAADGTAGGFALLDSSRFTDLDSACLSAARASTYVAATVNGILVSSRFVAPCTFNLDT